MLLTDLADVLRRGGLDVEEMAGWRTRGHGPMGGVRTIVCHHTAGPRSGEAPSLNTVMNGRPGLEGPLSHLVLGRSGTWYVVAAGLCWHAGATWTADQGNSWAIGIEAEATGVDGWPTEQYQSYARGCRVLADHYRVPVDRVLGHKEVAKPAGRKVDPNFDMNAFRRAVAAVTTSKEDDDMLPPKLPDFYKPGLPPQDTAGLLAWGVAHAAHARDAARANTAVLARVEKALADVSARLAKLEAKK